MCFFDPKIWIFGPKKPIFYIVIAIFVNGANNHYTRGYDFPIGTTPPKKFVFELGVIFWGSPLFLALLGNSHVRGIPTLNFGRISTKLGGTVRAIKKMTQRDNRPGPSRRNGCFYVRPKSGFGLKMGFNKKNHPK